MLFRSSAVGLSEAATPSQMHSYRLVSLSPANGNISGALRGQSSGTKFTGASLERSSLESNAESLREKLQRRLDGALSGKREENSPSPTMPVATALESSGGPALRALVTSQPDSSVSSGSQGLPQSDGDLAPFSANLGPPKMAMAGSETDEAVRRLMGIIAPEANAAETGALRGAEDGVDVTLFERTHLAYRNSLRLGRVRVKGSP